jgi:hypothetical protein
MVSARCLLIWPRDERVIGKYCTAVFERLNRCCSLVGCGCEWMKMEMWLLRDHDVF